MTRKTLRELAAEAATDSNGAVTCPKCNCADFRTYGSQPKRTATFRYKRCRNCGHRILTATTSQERIVRDVETEDDYPASCLPIDATA
ncbi:MAG: hypothetical protein HKN35_15755 [Woeseia sp.]|nr:hypothetical protein [Woeseia sp.]